MAHGHRLMSDFDYEGPNVPETVVADVVSEISNQGKLPPLTPEQVEQRQVEAQIYAIATTSANK